MKCHSYILVLCLLKLINAEAELSTVEELTAEHRSAKPEPFLDRLAAFFTGSTEKKQSAAASVQRPVAVLPPRPPLPPSRPNNIPLRKQSYKPKPAPVYQGQSVAPSNNFQTFVQPAPGKTSFFYFSLNQDEHGKLFKRESF